MEKNIIEIDGEMVCKRHKLPTLFNKKTMVEECLLCKEEKEGPIVVSERCQDCDVQMVLDPETGDTVCPRCGE